MSLSLPIGPIPLAAAPLGLPPSAIHITPQSPEPDESPTEHRYDGAGNNPDHPDWGSAHVQLLRQVPSAYADGVSEPSGQDRPNPRAISNAVNAQSELIDNERGMSNLLWVWGQFLDHDISLTEPAEPHEPFPIDVPTGDPFFDPFGTGQQQIDLDRSIYDEATGTDSQNPRQQINEITAFIDGSAVYGSDQARADALRTFEGGKLKTSDGNLLPYNTQGLPNAGLGGDPAELFLAGDVRANENVALAAMHTLWVREHNRLADHFAKKDPQLSDEQLYQKARAWVTAQIQIITYDEFLPALLGESAMGPYEGYDPSVNPGIANVFSTGIYRLGHSMLPGELARQDAQGQTIAAGNLSLRGAFFTTDPLEAEGIASLLRGLANTPAQELDHLVIDDVRNFLFGPPGAGGFDLVSLNIQRGRDHGLPGYNEVRRQLGLAPAQSFADVSSDPAVQQRLASVYQDVEQIDVWVGALAEDHVPGGSVGELLRTVMVDQFERLRSGDRFWYENAFEGMELRRLERTSLSGVIARNTQADDLGPRALFIPSAEENQESPPDRPKPMSEARRMAWFMLKSKPRLSEPMSLSLIQRASSLEQFMTGDRLRAQLGRMPEPTLGPMLRSVSLMSTR